MTNASQNAETIAKKGGKSAGVASDLSSAQLAQLRVLIKAKSISKDALNEKDLGDFLICDLVRLEGSKVLPTSQARQALRRLKLKKEEDAIFVAQHQQREKAEKSEAMPEVGRLKDKSNASIRVNRAESPLAMMALRKNKKGGAIISSVQYEAGERLRRDFERGHHGPSMGIDWQRLGQGGLDSRSHRSFNDCEDASQSALAARERFRKAMGEVGEEFAGPLIDLCCFLKGLEQIEKQRQWPARSAKLVLSMALARLARFYGLEEQATGPAKNPMRHWGEEGYRPSLPSIKEGKPQSGA
ncbi:MAG: DUF6456 domain-containing protein [Cohaesibacter sp.]|jgi:hypothetical protein|nr:DUF6456 domain-containing protein [Cohaesibacter sp.]